MGDCEVDINTASVETLEKLKGVGRAKAKAIILTRERSEFGSFQNIEGLLLVPGIGRNLLEQNRDILKCGPLPLAKKSRLRRSLRRGQSKSPKSKKMINSNVNEPVSGSSARTQKNSLSLYESPSGSRSSQSRDDSGSSRQSSMYDEEEESSDAEDDNFNDVLEFDSLDDDDDINSSELGASLIKAEQYPSGSIALDGTSSDSIRQDKSRLNSRLKSDKTISCGLGSDTPHDEAISDSIDVPLSPMRLTDGEDIEFDDGTGENVEDKIHVDEEQMVVDDQSILVPDKKQNKRKSEVCSESRGLCPVKKSCKAVDSSDGLEHMIHCHSSLKFTPPAALKSWLAKYQTWTPSQKLVALDSLIKICDLGQVRHIHQTILPQFQRDFISLLPKELALHVLSFLEPKDLVKAAQTCKYWNVLTADNLLWRRKCVEAGLDDTTILLPHKRKKLNTISPASPFKSAFMRQLRVEMNWRVNPLRPPRVLKGHDDHVITCLQFSGTTIVSGSDDNTLKVWNATSGKSVRTLTGHTGGVWSSQMCDTFIVSGSTDRMLRVWNADTGECIHTLYGHTSTVRCLHLHKHKVVSGSRDATLRVWDVCTGVCEHVLVGHVAAVRCVQYNGKLVVSGAYDYLVKVWNPEREECLHTLHGHTNRVYSLQFDGLHVVSGSLDTSIRVWNVETGQLRHTLMGHQSLTSGMELKNNILISGNADSTVKVWDILTGQCLQTLSGPNKHRSAVTCLQFNNKFVVTSSDDGTVKLWDVKTGEFIRNLVTLDSGGSGGVVWRIRASDTKLVCAVGSRNGTEETKLLVLDFDVHEPVAK